MLTARRFITGGNSPDSTTDPHWASVSLLLKMDGSNGSTTFTDSSDNAFTVTANGNSQISTTQSRFNGASGYFDGTGDYLSLAANSAFAFGTGDFTGEAWLYIVARTVTYNNFFSTAGVGSDFAFGTDSSGQVYFWNGATLTTFGGDVPNGFWCHVAISRDNGSVRAFVNGVQVGSTATITTDLGNSSEIQFPASADYSSNECYIDELRITKGVARYTSSFTPRRSPFPTTS